MRDLPKIEPMVLSLIPQAFDHPDWIFELKHDGFRAIAYLQNGVCQLVSRHRNEYRSFRRLQTELARALKVDDAILDGEIVCLDRGGRSMFNELLFRRGYPVFYAFDLLWLNGKDIRQKPLHVRKATLQRVIQRARCEEVFFAQHIEEHGVSLFQLACKQDTEGVVAKRKNGIYAAGERWFKIKNRNYTQVVGRHELFDSLRPPKREAISPEAPHARQRVGKFRR